MTTAQAAAMVPVILGKLRTTLVTHAQTLRDRAIMVDGGFIRMGTERAARQATADARLVGDALLLWPAAPAWPAEMVRAKTLVTQATPRDRRLHHSRGLALRNARMAVDATILGVHTWADKFVSWEDDERNDAAAAWIETLGDAMEALCAKAPWEEWCIGKHTEL